MAPSNQISVLSPLLVAAATAFCTIIVHGLILGMIITQVRRDLERGRVGIRFLTNLVFVTNVYHSAVNYTTLGDDTVVMSARWRLLGPLEAADGMLMFGVSTAMIFAVIQRLIQTRYGAVDR